MPCSVQENRQKPQLFVVITLCLRDRKRLLHSALRQKCQAKIVASCPETRLHFQQLSVHTFGFCKSPATVIGESEIPHYVGVEWILGQRRAQLPYCVVPTTKRVRKDSSNI